MKIIRSYQSVEPDMQGCVATIGNFDGMHLGHQALLTKTMEQAQQQQVKSCVILFEPHPKEFFMMEQCPPRLMSFREKVTYLRDFGIDQVLLLRFNKKCASTTAQDFVADILVKGLAIKGLVVGHDFRFGHGRTGSVDTLKQASEQWGFGLFAMSPHKVDEDLVSSTLIRQCLQNGDFDGVARLLGRRYLFTGRVCHGRGKGKQMGCPTANLAFNYRVMPLSGVFAAEVEDDSDQRFLAAVCVGYRPFVGGGERLLEAHLLDYHGNLYGKTIRVDIRKRLRDQWDFPSTGALRAQISRDVTTVRAYFDHGD